jgi:hypothetical protein
MFRDAQEATQIYTRVTAAGILRGYENLFVIAAVGTAPLIIHMRTPAASLHDLKGKKLRTTNQTEANVLRALGMEPQSIPINEAADAINRGVTDGATAARRRRDRQTSSLSRPGRRRSGTGLLFRPAGPRLRGRRQHSCRLSKAACTHARGKVGIAARPIVGSGPRIISTLHPVTVLRWRLPITSPTR